MSNHFKLLKDFFTPERVIFQKREGADSNIKKLYSRMVETKEKLTDFKLNQSSERIYFSSGRFFLNQSATFNSLSPEIQKQILKDITRHSLLTSFFIEKGAVTYCARMALLAETLEEKCLFLLMGEEEVVHLFEFEKFLTQEEVSLNSTSPFILELNRLIQNNDRIHSFLIAQVLLEGMALEHYKNLKESCTLPELSELLDRVIRDESRHHGSGIVLLDEASISEAELISLVNVTKEVIPLIVGQKDSLYSILGKNITSDQVQRIFLEINIEEQMKHRLSVIKKSIKKIKNTPLKQALLSIAELNS